MRTLSEFQCKIKVKADTDHVGILDFGLSDASSLDKSGASDSKSSNS